MPVFMLRNLQASQVETVDKPWDLSIETPASMSKEEYQNWGSNPATEHAFISGYEGVNPHLRVSGNTSKDGGNPAYRMHAAIVDYDASQDVAERVQQAMTKPPCEFMPAYFYPTLRHMRGIWVFEGPVNLPQSAPAQKKFASILSKKLMLRKWAAGYEEEAFMQTSKYYAMHGAWQGVKPKYRIPLDMLNLWVFQACEPFRLTPNEPVIPIEKVAEEVERRWPGRWKGDFAFGARGVRFWDPSSADSTVCQIHQDGVVVYNGDPKPFLSWGDIFGRSFVEKFEADRFAAVSERVIYDAEGEKFYVKANDGFYESQSKSDFAQRLRVGGISGAISKGETASAIDRCEQKIKTEKYVTGARPFVFREPGIVMHQGRRVLNTARCRPMEPAPAGTLFTLRDFREQAPNLWRFLSEFFDDPEGADVPQLIHFLAWLKVFYTSALRHEPQPGQVLILAGPPETGKTFLTDVVIGGLMGGVCDARDFLTQGGQWTDFLEYGVAKIDDAICRNDPKAHGRFSELLKALASTALWTMNAKYAKTGQVEWLGRATVAMNNDAISIQMMPSMDISAATKFSLLLVKRTSTVFRTREENMAAFGPELPLLGRFLLEWDLPSYVIDVLNPRYTIKPYHHPELLSESIQSGPTHSFYELLSSWAVVHKDLHPEIDTWRGTTTELYQAMTLIESIRPLALRYTAKALGTLMASLASKNIIRQSKSKGRTINVIVFEQLINGDNGDAMAAFTQAVAKEMAAPTGEDHDHESAAVDLHPRVLSALRAEAPRQSAGQEGGDQGGVS